MSCIAAPKRRRSSPARSPFASATASASRDRCSTYATAARVLRRTPCPHHSELGGQQQDRQTVSRRRLTVRAVRPPSPSRPTAWSSPRRPRIRRSASPSCAFENSTRDRAGSFVGCYPHRVSPHLCKALDRSKSPRESLALLASILFSYGRARRRQYPMRQRKNHP